ncbi:CPBP family intramembrane glutamic endopeptidase [Pontixanthobacter sp.]|uniref:CPBP family intramembrane glutamic endopeptidase n=1 Tax=Pontixanthobacter sp. TaxID=2792078 RepID=UPI003C7AE7A7
MPNSTTHVSVARTSAETPLWRQIWEFPVIAMVAALAVLAVTEFAFSKLAGLLPGIIDGDGAVVIGGILALALIVAVNKLVFARLGYVKHDDLPGDSAVGDSMLGIFVGSAVLSAIVGLAAAFGLYRAQTYGAAGDFAAIIVQGALVSAVFQEVLFRGIILRLLVPITGSLLALLLSCAAYAAFFAGTTGADWPVAIMVAVSTGLLFGGCYLLTENLWLAIGAHIGWNLALGLVWGMPIMGVQYQGFLDAAVNGPLWLTGGYLGLQASALALIVAGAAGVWMILQTRGEDRLIAPFWSR